MATQTVTYAATSWAFMSQAEAALARGNLAQASRQGWNAAAWALRGFAREKGWCYTGFYGIDGVVNQLVEEYDADDLDIHFCSARSLEMNSYEDSDTPLGVEICLGEVAQLLRKLERLP